MYRGKYETGADASKRVSAEELAQKKVTQTPPRDTSPAAVKTAPKAVKTAPKKKAKAGKQKKRITVGTVIFYVLYLAMIVGFFVALQPVLGALEGWLTQYEASQPNVKCQEVFDDLFADPDWGRIYDLAGLQSDTYESRDSFVRYMENKVGGQTLTYSETSAGLSGDHKYVVKLGDEKLAVYTLHAEEHTQLEIPQWELGSVEVFLTRTEHVTIVTAPDRTVLVNGVALDETHVVSTTQSAAEEYLPQGIHGFRSQTMYLDGLLVPPEVTVTDSLGAAVTLQYDEATRTYSETLIQTAHTIGDEEFNAVVDAAKVYSRYMIEATTATNLGRYFDTDSTTYKQIVKLALWMQNTYRGYEFTEPEITGYYRYSDELYSAKISMDLNVTRANGTVKVYELDSTFFMQKNDKDKWLVINMTNVDVQEQTTLVRLVYTVDGETVRDEMVDAAAEQLTPPEVTAPEGKTFTGWYRQETDANGDTTYSLVFTPDEYGNVYFNEGNILEYMTLYALFS